MEQFCIVRCESIQAEISIPGDKSISHRSVMLASLAEGSSNIIGFLESEDCLSTIHAMRLLGAHIEHVSQGNFRIEGTGGHLSQPSGDLYCGNSGTTMRLLSGIIAAHPIRVRMTGDASLSKRPMARVIEPLTSMGASFTTEGNEGRPPLVVEGALLKPISYDMPIASAQVKSAILLAGLATEGRTYVTEPAPCRDHTERMMQDFGVTLERGILTTNGRSFITLQGKQKLYGRTFIVPGDISSAAFWLVAGAAKKGSEIVMRNVGLNPTRNGIIRVLQRMGAKIRIISSDLQVAEPFGDIIVQGEQLRGTMIASTEIPNIIDELPILAIAGALACGTTIIRDARELRFKESDRIASIVCNLTAMGAKVTETEDGLIIHGGLPLHGAHLQCFHDHRIAMAFAIAGLFAEGETIIEHVECVATSYPTFGRTLDALLRKNH